MEDNYKNDFEKFLAHTDEKQVFSDEISKEIKKYKVGSLVDIGAGNGLLSEKISKMVKNYLAVEPNNNFVEKLQRHGLDVVEGAFPLEISGTFDMALASHSISYNPDLFQPFIRSAWELVKPKGIFLIITYRGQEDDWTRLLKNFGKNKEDLNRSGFNKIIELLFSLGEVKARKVVTQLKTDNLDDMVQALSFVASDGKPERKAEFLKNRAKLEKILSQKYRDKNKYFFPFQHFFITTEKI